MKTLALFLLSAQLTAPHLFAAEPSHETPVPAASRPELQGDLVKFRAQAVQLFGDEGQAAADFLIQGMPSVDQKELASDLLVTNLSYAFKAREGFPWSEEIPENLFLNDVLPYAVLDETREDWREEFYGLASRLVKGCETASEAAQVLNRDLFDELGFHYNRGRKKPNQSPSESRATGKATCTGLSIALTYACRSVGIPARLVGTPLWSDRSGNHSWVEIWDGEWKFLGADEYDPKGLNRGWFVNRASKAQAGQWQHAIWATSWNAEDHHFPMVWAQQNKELGAVNVTERYLQKEAVAKKPSLAVRVFREQGGSRVEARVSLLGAEGQVLNSAMSKAGRADMNDVATLPLAGKGPWEVLVTGWGKQVTVVLNEVPTQTLDVVLDDEQAKEVKNVEAPGDKGVSLDLDALVQAWKEEGKEAREKELAAKVIKADGHEMRFLERTFGEAPAEGHSLWISMHGGGGAPPAVNDRQWQNQIKLYQPVEGYYVAPRAPTDSWNLWHRGEIDPLFERLISNYVACRGVDPNRIYLMGYSAGGDGVYQVGTRMADRFAAASMMAGHPNEAKPDGLRNLRFEIFMGGLDAAYKRNQIAAKWKGWLADLQAKDPEGYSHRVTIYPEAGHWMNRKDGEALPRMAKEKRREWPQKVVWLQDDVTHERFYWLGVSEEGAVKGRRLEAEVNGQVISVTGEDVSGLRLWLSDDLLDLDQEVVVLGNGKELFRGRVTRSEEVVKQSLRQRCGMIATALLKLD